MARVGRLTSRAPAMAWPNGTDWPPATLFRAIVTGHESRLVIIAPNMKSFHDDVNCQMTATAKAGLDSGTARSTQVRRTPAPSRLADSSSASGIDTKWLRKIRVVIGRP